MVRVLQRISRDFDSDHAATLPVPAGAEVLDVDFDLANISVLLECTYDSLHSKEADVLCYHWFESGDKIHDDTLSYAGMNGELILYCHRRDHADHNQVG